jgi:class 3 adenylate cyclase/tetratricopeptide (TPR) repeat protein
MTTERGWRSAARDAPFVGREVELDALSSILRQSLGGKPRVAVVCGEVGVGKTRLVREFTTIARRLDVRVVHGRATEDSSIPYQPFMAVLRACVSWAAASASGSSDATGLLNSRSGDAPQSTTEPHSARHGEAERLRIFLAVIQEVIALSQREPTLVVLEDLHWADASSLELFEHLAFAATDAAETERLPLMIVATHRPVEDRHRLRRILDRIHREAVSDTYVLEGLGTSDTEAMIRALDPFPVSNQLVQAVQSATHGYPLFVQEFLHQLRSSGLLEQVGGHTTVRALPTGIVPPRDVTSAVNARLKTMSEDELHVLALAALLGDSFALDRLSHVAHADSTSVLGLLERAVDQGLLVADEASFRFRHPLMRQALAGSVSPLRQQILHRQIAAALEERAEALSGAASLEIAGHLLASGPHAEPTTLAHHARRGADHAFSIFAWPVAARFYSRAAEAARSVQALRASAIGELHFLAGLAHQHDFDVGPCLEQYGRAMQAFREAGDLAGQAKTLCHQTRVRSIATTATNYGDHLDLGPHEQVLAALGDDEPWIRGLLLESMSQVRWTARDSQHAEALARRALEIAEQIGADRRRHHASFCLGLAQFQSGRLTDALASYEHSLEYARRTGDPWIENPPLQRLSVLHHAFGHLDQAERIAREACELAGRVFHAAEASFASANLATAAVTRGQFRDADERAREAMTLARRARYPWSAMIALLALSSARALQGKFRDARYCLTLIRTPGEVFDEPGPTVHFLATVYDDLLRVRAEPEAAHDDVRERLLVLTDILARSPLDANAASVLCAIVEIAAALGVPPCASLAHERLVALAENGMLLTSGAVFLVPRVLGISSALFGRAAEAEGYFRAAQRAAEDMGARPELGRCLLDRARLLLESGKVADRDAATACALRACSIFDELGMTPYFQRAARTAEAFGARAPRPSADARLSADLDPWEIEVLKRVARGRSAHDIAAELLLEPESVSASIERLFEKIDVSSPALAAVYAFGQGIVGSTSQPPPGPLVLMVTDMVGFTSFVERVGDVRAQGTIHAHNRAIRFQLARHHGKEVTHTGDGMMASFRSGDEATACAISIQRQFARYSDEHPDGPIRVRVGLNAGRVFPEEDRLFGAALNTAVRVCAKADAGQILLAGSALAMTSEAVSAQAYARGTFSLKGCAEPIPIYELPWSV